MLPDDTAPPNDTGGGPAVSIAVGVTIAVLASFVQSLGLTLQRRSHLDNESRLLAHRKRDWQRPLWLLGFAIFISSNVLGSVFQLASLSIVILAPLGAVSLLWNAFFARILLGDVFSRYLVMGTILIAGGAVLIAIFGVVPETTHSLPELLQLYRRPSFIVWISLQFAIILAVLGIAHWQERRLEARLQDVYIALPTSDDELEAGFASPLTPIQTPRSNVSRPKKVRRWSTPPAYLNLNGESGDSRPDPPSRPVTPATTRTAAVPSSRSTAGSRHVSFGANQYRSPTVSSIISESQSKRSVGASQKERSSIRPRLPQDRAEKMRIWLGIAFGSASGTMSGLCLLFAKTGVELLVLTVMGDNQFKRWESWMIVLALLICALLQLWYLNKSLRLAGPTLICPLAFCFYNLSSIFNGIMYYNQWKELSPLQDGLMSLGIVVLLAGVWIVSIKSSDGPVADGDSIDMTDAEEEEDALLSGEGEEDASELEEDDRSPEEETFGDLKSRIAHLYQAFLLDQAGPPRGFSVGISASSPGFAIRPAGHHTRRNTAASIPSFARSTARHAHSRSDEGGLASSPTAMHDESTPLRPGQLERTASEPSPGAGTATATRQQADHEMLNYRHRRKRSLAGDFYVGASDPFAESPVFETPLSPTSTTRSRSGSSASAQARRQSVADTGAINPQGPADRRRSSGLKRFLPWSVSPERVSQD